MKEDDYLELVRQLLRDCDPSERKLYLLGCACARLVPQLLIAPRVRQLIMAVERYADGLINFGTLELFTNQAGQHNYTGDRLSQWIAGLFQYEAIPHARIWARYTEADGSVDRLHDIFGNQFQRVIVKQNWITRDVSAIAANVYSSIPAIACQECGGQVGIKNPIWGRCRARCHKGKLPGYYFDNIRMNVLADAIEDAGCDNECVINHLRSSKPHVRGCWVIDAILGKS